MFELCAKHNIHIVSIHIVYFAVYTIVTLPEEGNVVRIEERNDQQKKRRLAANANFTQVC